MADSVGNRLGPRGTFDYESDNGTTFKMSVDRSVSEAIGNTLSTNANLPTLSPLFGKELRARYVLLALQSDPTITKRVVVGSPSNAIFVSNGTAPVTINGVAWIPTGRVGEKRSALKLTPAVDP